MVYPDFRIFTRPKIYKNRCRLQCFYFSLYIKVYLIISEDLNIINSLKSKSLESFCMIDLGLVSYYLGIAITQIREFISLDQKSYLEKISL